MQCKNKVESKTFSQYQMPYYTISLWKCDSKICSSHNFIQNVLFIHLIYLSVFLFVCLFLFHLFEMVVSTSKSSLKIRSVFSVRISMRLVFSGPIGDICKYSTDSSKRLEWNESEQKQVLTPKANRRCYRQFINNLFGEKIISNTSTLLQVPAIFLPSYPRGN